MMRSSRSRDVPITPSTTLIIRGLSPQTNEAAIHHIFSQYNPVRVRVILDRDTGIGRGFAFVDFATIPQADHVLSAYGGRVYIDGRSATLSYSTANENPIGPRYDWICERCEAINFSRRTHCFKCELPKGKNSVTVEVASPADARLENVPREVLSVRSIPLAADENELRDAFFKFSQNLQVRLVRDRDTNLSRGFGFVEFPSIEIATSVLNESSGIKIRGQALAISFAHDSFRSVNPTPNPIAAAAVEQAQWSMATRYYAEAKTHAATAPANNSSSNTQLKPRLQWPTPFESGGASYVFDASTGFYYETESAFYYDTTSKLYYSSFVKKYFKHHPQSDPPYTEFVPPPPDATPKMASSPSSAPERMPSQQGVVSFQIKPSTGEKSKRGVAKHTKVIEKWSKQQKESEDVNEANERAEIVSTKQSTVLCLLCRRRFKSLEQLEKHEKGSKLHQENLAKANQKNRKYRDRAQERRSIHDEGASEVIPGAANTSVYSGSSIDKPLASSSVGAKLLQQMGWTSGQGLGKHSQGITQPIVAVGQVDGELAGLGASTLMPADPSRSQKDVVRHKTRSRYETTE